MLVFVCTAERFCRSGNYDYFCLLCQRSQVFAATSLNADISIACISGPAHLPAGFWVLCHFRGRLQCPAANGSNFFGLPLLGILVEPTQLLKWSPHRPAPFEHLISSHGDWDPNVAAMSLSMSEPRSIYVSNISISL